MEFSEKNVIRKRGEDGYRQITVRLRESVYDEIERMSAVTNRSKNDLINRLLAYSVKCTEIIDDQDL